MGGSRRKFKRSRTKVRVGLPRKKPREFKPAFDLPEALAASAAAKHDGGPAPSWDAEGTVVKNYAAFGVVSNPNLLGAHSRGTARLVQSEDLQNPKLEEIRAATVEFGHIDNGSEDECDGQSPTLLPSPHLIAWVGSLASEFIVYVQFVLANLVVLIGTLDVS
jgi:nucleolar protein 16